MRRAGWGERGAGVDPHQGMSDDEVCAQLEAQLRQGCELAGGGSARPVERDELLGTRHEFAQIIDAPWRWDEADERFDGGGGRC